MLWRHLLLAVAVALTSLQISAGEKERPIPEPRTVGDKVLSDGQELDREMYASLPDFGDKAVMNRLRCGACQASVLEIAYEILRTETNMNRPCKEVEVRSRPRIRSLFSCLQRKICVQAAVTSSSPPWSRSRRS